MSFKSRMLLNAGAINENQYLKEEYLSEGIKFFKNSKRLEKLSNKLEKVKDPNLSGVKSKVKELITEFKALEDSFGKALDKKEKENLKKRYKEVESKNRELINLINKESVFKALKAAGLLAVVAGVAAIGVVHFDALNNFFSGKIQSMKASSELDAINSRMTEIDITKREIEQRDPSAGVTSMLSLGLFSSNPDYQALNNEWNKLFLSSGDVTARKLGGDIRSGIAADTVGAAGVYAGGVAGVGILGSIIGKLTKKISDNADVKKLSAIYKKIEKEGKK